MALKLVAIVRRSQAQHWHILFKMYWHVMLNEDENTIAKMQEIHFEKYPRVQVQTFRPIYCEP